jgi:hemolysin activation/secretion protein
VASVLAPVCARAQAIASPADGPFYPIRGFEIRYVDPNPNFPPAAEIAQTEIELGVADEGYVSPRRPFPTVRVRLAEVDTEKRFGRSAIRAINQQLVYEFNRRDFHAIVVAPVPEDIERRTGRDLRGERATLTLGVYAGRVKDLRTFASSEDVPEAERLDRPEHAWIKDGSPIQPNSDDDLVRKDALDAYIARLNRQPGRRIDAELSPARETGGVNLDYLVAEAKPWYAYSQISDTGTKATTELRERFGFTHNQLTGHDDVLRLEYYTGNFSEVNAGLASYEFPVWRGELLPTRTRVFGGYSQYDASVLGFQRSFSGKQWWAGFEVAPTIWQYRELFVDGLLGTRYTSIQVQNDRVDVNGRGEFFIPYFGLRVERSTEAWSFDGTATWEHNFPAYTETRSPSEYDKLGRFFVDPHFDVVRWDANLSFFLEPLLFPRTWRDGSVGNTAALTHEIYLATRGNWGLGDRLIPQEEQIAGGLYTVRGYPEAASVGDKVFMATLEYRFHVARLFKPSREAVKVPAIGRFRVRPQYSYSEPDWDFIIRPFVDWARVKSVRALPNEPSETLLGVGIGAEAHILRNVIARFDWGHALEGLTTNAALESDPNFTRVTSGHDEFHFAVTVLY